jgi:uncharacterized membrane protein YfcA
MPELFDIIILSLAGLVAGTVNAIAGGGTFFTFAALMAVGLPPIAANATSAVSVMPGSIASTFAYRSEIRALGKILLPLCLISAVGGLLGGWLLLGTDNTTFRGLVPWLLLFATVLFAISPKMPGLLARIRRTRIRPAAGAGVRVTAGAIALQGIVAIYGGYFGAGMGIMMLASLALVFGDRYHDANAAKNILSVFMQGFAVILFLFSGLVHWPEAAVVTVSSIIGGSAGVVVAKQIPTKFIRLAVVAVGALLSAWYFLQ